jgi:acyl-CoA reductase-like NAD-dependent aldehyde dehydrogenase
VRIADAIRSRAPEIANLEALEHGTPYKEALGITMGAAAKFENTAWLAKTVMGDQLPVPGSTTISYLQREAVGVVGLIVPWNLPTIMIAVKLAPALAMGNTCVLKPPSINSMIGLKFAEIISTVEGLPEGAVNVVTGSGSVVGNAIAPHPMVDMRDGAGRQQPGHRHARRGPGRGHEGPGAPPVQ